MTLAAGTAGGGSLTVPGPSAPPPVVETPAPPAPVALTASFHGAPEAHDGKKLFAFEIRFNRAFDGLRLGAFKQALSVTNGRVVDVKRTVRGENGGVTVRVRPSSSGALTVTLAAGTAGGGSLTVPGPSAPPPVVQTPDPAPTTQALLALGGLPIPPPPEVIAEVAANRALMRRGRSINTGTTAPSNLPSGTGTVVNMKHMGHWRAWDPAQSRGTDLQLLERHAGNSLVQLNTPCFAISGTTGQPTSTITTCLPGGAVTQAGVASGGVNFEELWYTYPHNAGASDMKVHVRVKRAQDALTGRGNLTFGDKTDMAQFFNYFGHHWLGYDGTYEGVTVPADPFIAPRRIWRRPP